MADRIPKCPKCRHLASHVRQKTTEVVHWRVATVHPCGDVPMFVMGGMDVDRCVIATCSHCKHEWCPRGVAQLSDLQPPAVPEVARHG